MILRLEPVKPPRHSDLATSYPGGYELAKCICRSTSSYLSWVANFRWVLSGAQGGRRSARKGMKGVYWVRHRLIITSWTYDSYGALCHKPPPMRIDELFALDSTDAEGRRVSGRLDIHGISTLHVSAKECGNFVYPNNDKSRPPDSWDHCQLISYVEGSAVLVRAKKATDPSGVEVPSGDFDNFALSGQATAAQADSDWRSSRGKAFDGGGNAIEFEPPSSREARRVRYNYAYAAAVSHCGGKGRIVVDRDPSEKAPIRLADDFKLPPPAPGEERPPWGPDGMDQTKRDELERGGWDSGTDSSGNGISDTLDVLSTRGQSLVDEHRQFRPSPEAWMEQARGRGPAGDPQMPPHVLDLADHWERLSRREH